MGQSVRARARYKDPVFTQAKILQRTFAKSIYELKTWQMYGERCVSHGSMLTSSQKAV